MKIDQDIEVVNKLGLHARAAAKLVKVCTGFSCDIKLAKGNKVVDGKSIMGVLMLAASQGTVLKLTLEGGDAKIAADTIQGLFANYFGEGE